MQSTKSPTRNTGPLARRLAAGTLMTTLFVGATAAPALAVEPGLASSRAADTVSVFTWPTTSSTGPTTSSAGSPTAVKSTPARWLEDNGARYDAGSLVKVGVVWAVAAAVVMAGVLGGSLLGRRAAR